MKTISSLYTAHYEIKKSLFIAHLSPFNEFKNLLSALKKEHSKAVHFVWAYRFLNENHQIVEDKSDDGEPKNTSALPCLNVLRGKELVNVSVIVVRYFGGIKLGTGGLVRAYGEAVNLAVKEAILEPFELKEGVEFSLDFKTSSKMEHFLKKNNIAFQREFKETHIIFKLELSQKEKAEFESFSKTFSPKELKIL
ncbi:YigZ family protein [Campylobacter vulpis]|uniref:Phosphoenolpyruvate carboxykinase n=1 Tax=Campylobacter vulpis TaxID=1655500 RepID=A0A2G4R4T9_9BACT|nr:YigZ family protein [Campylobacter vulpis]MBS4241445.1 YigZ family protein [Campylobacter vulpis]MBS4332131.1 YigZ family protein [Campylobacter vulpis]MBS4407739.1 YigZ family protein [Campylobacter vulpis]MBS4439958.1 YigZ family protein [Campylobacter vulpis]PHY91554.1 phosphoenolpyruvate carboxykinase [Campylobacter vulpis]